jgi:hypothetical protein
MKEAFNNFFLAKVCIIEGHLNRIFVDIFERYQASKNDIDLDIP